MKKTLKDVLVICNLDNALMTPAQEILSCNVEMVRLFCTLGGRFTIATARTLSSTKEVVKDLCINAPVAVCGGGMVVDWESEQVLQKHCLDSQTALQLIQDVQSRFPDTGIEIVDDMGKVLVLQSSAYTNEHIIRENLECIYRGYAIPMDKNCVYRFFQNVAADFCFCSIWKLFPVATSVYQPYLL